LHDCALSLVLARERATLRGRSGHAGPGAARVCRGRACSIMNPAAVRTIDVSELPPHVMDHRSPIWWGNVLLLCIETTMFALRFLEFSGLKFRWDDNAYAAIVWTTIGMHLLHLVTGTAENFIMTLWVWLKGMDDKHARDVRVGAVYWYWIVGIWVPLYVIIYFGPRFL